MASTFLTSRRAGTIRSSVSLQSMPGYQVPFAAAVKHALGDKIFVAAVGKIHEGKFAQSILDKVYRICVCV